MLKGVKVEELDVMNVQDPHPERSYLEIFGVVLYLLCPTPDELILHDECSLVVFCRGWRSTYRCQDTKIEPRQRSFKSFITKPTSFATPLNACSILTSHVPHTTPLSSAAF
jgi:hypothetical protein